MKKAKKRDTAPLKSGREINAAVCFSFLLKRCNLHILKMNNFTKLSDQSFFRTQMF